MAFTISSFTSKDSFKEYSRIFNEELHLRAGLLKRTKDMLGYKDYSFDQLTEGSLDFIRRTTEDIIYKTDDLYKEQFPDGKMDTSPLFVPRTSLKDSIKDALKELAKETYLEPDPEAK